MNRIFLTLLLLTVSILAFSQRTVSGLVTDEQGEPLMYATVVVQSADGSSSNGTTTDLDGNFSIMVPQGENTLFVSYIGYQSKVVDITGQDNVTIALPMESTMMEDVVVTALGIKKEKKALGYSFSDVKGDELTTNRDVNFINSISNKVAGVNITQTAGGAGTSSRIIIRGVKSLSSESQPLIVIDGVPVDNSSDGATWLGGVDYGNSLMGVSPDDIETMSVLKGPNAAALYGSRAATGVILITTKSASKSDRLKVTLNSNFMVDNAYLLGKFQNEYGVGGNGSLGKKEELTPEEQAKYGVDSLQRPYGGSFGSWGPRLTGQDTILNWNDEFITLQAHPNNVKDYFRTGFTATNSVALESGTEKLNWRFSVGTLNNKGLKPNSTYDRKTINFNINSKMNDYLGLSFKANYIREDAFNRVNQGNSQSGSRNFVWMPRSVDIHTLEADYMSDQGYEQNWNFLSDPPHTNPYWEAYKNYNNDYKDQFIGLVKLDIKITPWLTGLVRSSMDTYSTKRYLRIANKALTTSLGAREEGAYKEYWKNFRSLNHEFLLTANRDIGSNLSLSVNAGGNYYRIFSDSQSTSIAGLAVPDFFSLNNKKYPDEVSTGTYRYEKVIQSVYGTSQLNYKSLLYLELTARNDWSSSLSFDNSYFYPSVNSSFVFSKLLNIDESVFTFGKVRAGYAYVGNDTRAHQLSWRFINQKYGDMAAVYLDPVGFNERLVPESTGSWEFGFDLRFFMSRLNFDITYYNETTYDQIIQAELSRASGLSYILTNGGEMGNKGIELQISGIPVETDNFTWNLDLNMAKNRNEVKSLPEGFDQYTITKTSQISVVAVPGEPYGEIIGSIYKKYWGGEGDPNNGKALVDPATGLLIQGGADVIGNVTPDLTGGLSSMMRYKNLSLAFSIGFQKGGDIFSKTNKYGKDAGQFVETLEGRESWYNGTQEEKDAGTVGYVVDGVYADGSINTKGIDPQVFWHLRKWNGIAEVDIYDASYIKLRDVTLNYNLPVHFFENSIISSASVSLIGKNLWLIYSGIPHVDPESSFSSGNNGLGQEYGSMPPTRSYGINLKVVF